MDGGDQDIRFHRLTERGQELVPPERIRKLSGIKCGGRFFLERGGQRHHVKKRKAPAQAGEQQNDNGPGQAAHESGETRLFFAIITILRDI